MLIEKTVNEIIHELQYNNIDFTIKGIADYYNILLTYNDKVSLYANFNGFPIIYIKRSDSKHEWLDFINQIGHFFLHESTQYNLSNSYNDIQKSEAYKFSILFRMPQCEIESHNLYTQKTLMNHFNVDYASAHKRLCYLNEWYASEGWCKV